MGAGLAVDADADLHLVFAQFKAGLARRRDRARLDGNAHGAHIVDDLLRHALHLLELRALLRLRARDHRVQHARADIAAVRRFVAGAAAGDQRDLPLLLLCPHDHVSAVQLPYILGVGFDHARDHLIFHKLDLVDDFFIVSSSCQFVSYPCTNFSLPYFFVRINRFCAVKRVVFVYHAQFFDRF